MTGLETLFDLLVVLLLVVAAIGSLHAPHLFTSIAFFISYGLVMAVVWVRLEAPDVALAEAAVGAGLTGVLLLDAVRERGARRRGAAPERARLALAAPPALALLALLALALRELPQAAAGLAAAVAEALPPTGIEHGVTAVLLAFRAVDTFLEMAVLLAAVLTLLVLHRAQDVRVMPRELEPSPVLSGLLRLLTPVVVVTGGYLLWIGTSEPGGAFQAGVLIGAGGILLELAGVRTVSRLPRPLLTLLLALGVAGFLVVGGALLAFGGAPLDLPEGWSRTIIIALEVAIAVSVAATVVGLMEAANLHLGREGER
jgi:multisubunit Na+/H+ antiporter MnhB subunit